MSSLTDRISTMRLFSQSGVTGFSSGGPSTFIGLLGWSLAVATMYFYFASRTLACSASPEGVICHSWSLIIGAHAFVMILVAVEAIFTTGFFWPLQMVIIGTGSSITFSVAALLGAAYANEGKVEAQYTYHTMGSLFVACFSNAMMLAMMWEHFHRAGYVALTRGKSE